MNRTFAAIVAATAVLAALIFLQSAGAQSASAMNRMSPEQAREENAYAIGLQAYPNTSVDDKGEQLTGARRYVLQFDAGKLPPVATFWNLAMYGSDMLFVENDFGRYSFGSTTDGLKKGADGSLSIVIQNDKPADVSNWLPAPAGNFNLTMRFYGPQTPVPTGCPQ